MNFLGIYVATNCKRWHLVAGKKVLTTTLVHICGPLFRTTTLVQRSLSSVTNWNLVALLWSQWTISSDKDQMDTNHTGNRFCDVLNENRHHGLIYLSVCAHAVESVGRSRGYGHVGGGVALGVGFEVWKLHARPSLLFSASNFLVSCCPGDMPCTQPQWAWTNSLNCKQTLVKYFLFFILGRCVSSQQ